MSAVGSLVGNFVQAGATKKAAKAQTRALNEARAVSERNYLEAKDLLAPFIDSGNLAHQAILFDRGLGPAPTISTGGYEVGGSTYGTREEAENALQQATTRFNSAAMVRSAIPNPAADSWAYRRDADKAPPTAYSTSFDPSRGVSAAGFDPRGASVQEVDPATYQGFQFSPDHEFLMKQGLDAVSSQASATGSRNSGATLSALQDRGTSLANTFREQYLGALGVLSSQGQGAIGQQIAAGNNNASNVGSLLTQQGNVEASSAIAQGRLFGQSIADGFSAAGQLFGGFGGGGGGIMSGINAGSQYVTGSAAPIFSPQPTARPTLSF